MTRSKYAVLAVVPLVIYLGARVTDLDLGGFGIGLLIMAAAFGIAAVVAPKTQEPIDG